MKRSEKVRNELAKDQGTAETATSIEQAALQEGQNEKETAPATEGAASAEIATPRAIAEVAAEKATGTPGTTQGTTPPQATKPPDEKEAGGQETPDGEKSGVFGGPVEWTRKLGGEEPKGTGKQVIAKVIRRVRNPHVIIATIEKIGEIRVRVQKAENFPDGFEIPVRPIGQAAGGAIDLWELTRKEPRGRGRW